MKAEVLLGRFSVLPWSIAEGAGGVHVSGGTAACECPWWEATMLPFWVRNNSGMLWLSPPFCLQGEREWVVEELWDAVPMFER